METVLDARETRLINALSGKDGLGKAVKTELLTSGDVALRFNGQLVALAERKTLNDLDSSIQDGRFAEQRTTLLDLKQQDPHLVILYIIEGSEESNRYHTPDGSKRVKGALENLAIVHNICCLHTADVADTAQLICNLAQKFEDRLRGKNGHIVRTVPLSRKAKITDNMLACLLNVIPGVSMTAATRISEKYTSMEHLISELSGSDDLLANVQISERKRVGTALSKRIRAALCH